MKNDIKPNWDPNAKAETYNSSTAWLRFVDIPAWLSVRVKSKSTSKIQ